MLKITKIMKIQFFLIIFFTVNMLSFQPFYFCTGCNTAYYNQALNLIGSIHASNFYKLGKIAVFDLGLTPAQVKHLNSIAKVHVYKFPGDRTLLDNLRWFMWKPIIIKKALEIFPIILYLDAGTTVLKPLDDLFSYIQEKDYFICTIGNEKLNGIWRHPIKWGTTQFVHNQFDLDNPEKKWVLEQEFVMGGIIGLNRAGFDVVLRTLCDLTHDQRYYKSELDAQGIYKGRHDQTLLSIHAYLKSLIIHKQDYMQVHPMQLQLSNKLAQFTITWHSDYVSQDTHIYSSRRDIKNFSYYISRIKYK
jgi:hypothetical protein